MTTEELDDILKRHVEDKAFCAAMHMEHPPQVQDVAALLQAIGSLKAENERLRAAEGAIQDLGYGLGFRAGWNAGVEYESCQEVKHERKERGNPGECLRVLASMDDRILEARRVLNLEKTQ